MSWTRSEVKERAKAQLNRQYFHYLLASFLLALLGGGTGGFASWNVQSGSGVNGEVNWILTGVVAVVMAIAVCISLGISIFVAGPLEVGVRRFYLAGMHGRAPLTLIGSGFRKEEYFSQVVTVFVPKIFVFLWSLLLIIPGIVKSYEYYFVSYIAAERPGIGAKEAMELSRKMTKGHKWEMFVLDLSFFGWLLLGAMCCGIGTFFVRPYIDAAFAQLYDMLKVPEVL